MDDIRLTRQFLAEGFDADEIRQLVRDGTLQRVRRGAYAPPTPDLSTEDAHRRLILATLPQLQRAGVLSHGSAAVIHGLPVWSSAVDRVHVTRARTGGGVRRHLVEVHTSPPRGA